MEDREAATTRVMQLTAVTEIAGHRLTPGPGSGMFSQPAPRRVVKEGVVGEPGERAEGEMEMSVAAAA